MACLFKYAAWYNDWRISETQHLLILFDLRVSVQIIQQWWQKQQHMAHLSMTCMNSNDLWSWMKILDRFRKLNAPSIFLQIFLRLTPFNIFTKAKILHSQNCIQKTCQASNFLSRCPILISGNVHNTRKWNYTAAKNFLMNGLSLSLGTIPTLRKRKISASLVS